MQFEDPDWRAKSPGPMPDHAVTHFWYEAVTTIAKRGRALDILDAFMWRFSNGTARRTGDINRVEGQLSGYMHEMGKNAALFTEALAAAHADLRELGYDAPDLNALNDDLSRHYTGFHIDGDTLRQRRSRRPENEPVFHVPRTPRSQ
jgi:hypothetical protein